MSIFLRNSQKRILLAVLMIALAFGVVTGCSSTPSESDAKKVYENLLKKQSSDSNAVTLVSFKKTNAQESTLFGVEVYTVFADVEVKSQRNTIVYRQGINELEIQVMFEKTEKGWQGQDGNIY